MKICTDVRIGDVSEVKGGKRLPKGESVQDEPTAYPYLRVVDFGENGINRANIKFIEERVQQQVSRYKITEQDIYVSIAGTIGRVGVVPADLSGANLTENAAKITAISERIDNRYLMYFLRGPTGQSSMRNQTGGTSQPKLALYRIEDIRFPCPSFPTQREIADILSAYDDLIENNQRRIALLEETARLLYREWFVYFRFPGHEHVKITNGLPDGWERRTLGSVLNLQRGFDLPVNSRVAGGVPVYGSTGIVGEHNVIKVTFPTLITGRSGSLGKVCFADGPCWPLNTSLWVTNFKAVSLYLAYFILSELDLAKFNAGASVPTLDRKVAHAANVLVPTRNIATLFDEQMEVIFTQKKLLDQQIQKLAQARDLLLPRLMNGEIVV